MMCKIVFTVDKKYGTFCMGTSCYLRENVMKDSQMPYDMLLSLITFLFLNPFKNKKHTLICLQSPHLSKLFHNFRMHITIVNKQNACIFAISAYTLLCTVLHGYAQIIKQHKQYMSGGVLSNLISNHNIDMHLIFIKTCDRNLWKHGFY